jgi:hypothetical protein
MLLTPSQFQTQDRTSSSQPSNQKRVDDLKRIKGVMDCKDASVQEREGACAQVMGVNGNEKVAETEETVLMAKG